MENLKRLLPYIKPHRKAVALASLCMLLSGILGGAFLFLAERVLKPMLDPGASYTVILEPLVSDDPNYKGFDPPDVPVNNGKDGVVVITPQYVLSTSASGGVTAFAVHLRQVPTTAVTLPLHSSDTALGSVSTTSLTFTPQNYAQPQRVTVTSVPAVGSSAETRLHKLNYFVLIVFVVALLRVATDFGQVYIAQRTGQRVLAKIRSDLFAHFQDLSVGFFEQRRTGEIMSRLTNDLSALQGVMTLAVATAISSPVELVIALGFMIIRNWQLSLFVLLILPPAALLINRAGRNIRGATAHLQIQLALLTDYLQEKIAAMRLIQTFGAKAHEVALFEAVNQGAYRSTMKPVRIQAALAPVIEFTGMMGVVSCLWFGGRSVVHGQMDAASLLVFLLAMHRTAMRAKALAGLNLMFKQADAAAARLFEIFDTMPDVRDAPGAIDLAQRPVQGHLAFEDVRFAYFNGPEILHGISFEIKPGEVVALAGLSGSGKTTIAALVPRLYDPTAGRVLLDGLELRQVTLQSLRAHIGAVPQETTLFHGSIRDNIAYGRPDAADEEIIEAARRANADNFIREQPDGYDTQIGERGGKLSGGQRQRIAIARALLRDPRILILDEATSSLDAESERLVQDALDVLMEGRSTLIIAHRFSTIQRADRIIVLDHGHIVETGTHEELLAQQGRYFRLYQMQAFEAQQENGAVAVNADAAGAELATATV